MMDMAVTVISCFLVGGASSGQELEDTIRVGSGATPSGQIQPANVQPVHSLTQGSAIVVVDISGTESWDLQGDPSNTVLDVPIPGAEVSGIGWDLSLTTVGSSWLSESAISFQGSQDSLFLSVGTGDNSSGSASYSSDGILLLSDLGIPNIQIDGGSMALEFFETFDNVPDAPEAIYTNGTISIQYEAPAVPAVSGAGMAVLVLFLFLAMCLSTKARKRKHAIRALHGNVPGR